MTQQGKEEPRGKRELLLEAAFKVFSGQKLVDEGNFEIDALLGEHSLKKKPATKKGPLTPGQKSALTKKKLIAHRKRDSDFRKDNRSDETILNKMVDIVRKNRQASTILFKKKLKLSERRLHKLLGIAQGRNLLHNESSGEDGARHKWVLGKETAKPVKEQKAINGHKLAKTPGNGGGMKNGHKTIGGRGSQIDVTNPELIAKAKEYLKKNDWVNKGMFIDAVDLSPGPANRLLEYMQKEGIVKTVKKKNNPAHDKNGGLRKLFVRPMPYIELA